MAETFTVDVMKGKKKVIGMVNIDASQGVWPMGEWIPTEPIEDDFELVQAGKKAKFEGSPGSITVSYAYAGSGEASLCQLLFRSAPATSVLHAIG